MQSMERIIVPVPGCGRSAPNASQQLPAYQNSASYAPAAEGWRGNFSKLSLEQIGEKKTCASICAIAPSLCKNTPESLKPILSELLGIDQDFLSGASMRYLGGTQKL